MAKNLISISNNEGEYFTHKGVRYRFLRTEYYRDKKGKRDKQFLYEKVANEIPFDEEKEKDKFDDVPYGDITL